MKKLLFVALAALIALSGALFSGCAKDENVLIMSTESGFKPFEYLEGGKVIGIDVEIMEAVAKKMGKTLQINDVPFTAVLTEVAQGKADIGAAGLTINDARQKTNDFSNSYYSASQHIIVGSADTAFDGATTIAEVEAILAALTGKKAGVQSGTTSESYLLGEDEEGGFPGFENIEVVPYNNGSFAVEAFKGGSIDFILIDEMTAHALVKANTGDIKVIGVALTDEQYGFAVKKGNTELLAIINQVLEELEESGELQKIFDKHILA